MEKWIGKHQSFNTRLVKTRGYLGIGGHKESCFLISRDMENNLVYVGEGRNFPGLFRKALKLIIQKLHWIREDLRLKNGESMEVLARIRYRQPLEKATLYQFEEGFL